MSASRNEQARQAADALLGSQNGRGYGKEFHNVIIFVCLIQSAGGRQYMLHGIIPAFVRILSETQKSISSSSSVTIVPDKVPFNNRACYGYMSHVRRTFCLIVTFDLILTFILWVMYVKLKDSTGDFWQSFKDEVEHYLFSGSFFDFVMCAAIRFLILIFAYALFRIRNPSAIAITTFFTCVYVIAKAFMIDHFKDNPMGYVLMVETFIMAWIETWFLDFRVLPQEIVNTRELYSPMGGDVGGAERRPFLQNTDNENEAPFLTPEEGSDNEENKDDGVVEILSAKDQEYVRKAKGAFHAAEQILNTHQGWRRDSSVEDIVVHSQHFANYGKLLRLEAVIESSPQAVFEITTKKCEETPRWNHTVLESKILHKINSSTDIMYHVTAEAGKGIVSSRDFVSVRHWRSLPNGTILSVSSSVDFPGAPNKQHVRGDTRLAGWLFEPVHGNPNRCNLRIVVGTDIKGWIPQVVVDQALTGVLVDCIRCLRRYMTRSGS